MPAGSPEATEWGFGTASPEELGPEELSPWQMITLPDRIIT